MHKQFLTFFARRNEREKSCEMDFYSLTCTPDHSKMISIIIYRQVDRMKAIIRNRVRMHSEFKRCAPPFSPLSQLADEWAMSVHWWIGPARVKTTSQLSLWENFNDLTLWVGTPNAKLQKLLSAGEVSETQFLTLICDFSSVRRESTLSIRRICRPYGAQLTSYVCTRHISFRRF